MNKNKRGFTLVELLVVISIIAILATLLMANFIGVRQRGRDGQRKSNLFQVQSALELYRSDAGNYPDTASFPACGSAITANGTIYMTKVPCDPLGGDYTYTSADGSTYTIYACLENPEDNQRDTSPSGSCTTSFTLNNP